MNKNDSGLRAMLEELDAEMERRCKASVRELLASGSGMHWIAERASRHGLTTEQASGLLTQ